MQRDEYTTEMRLEAAEEAVTAQDLREYRAYLDQIADQAMEVAA